MLVPETCNTKISEKTYFTTVFNNYLKESLSKNEKKDFIALLKEKKIINQLNSNFPLEYIFQKGIFMGNILKCTPNTFIPRKETELLVKKALNFTDIFKKKPVIFDIGTGTGNIAIALALYKRDIHIFSSDISKEAIKVAQENIVNYHLEDRITLLHGDMFSPHKKQLQGEKADLILCNPPYIPTKKLKNMPSKIINYEPIIAFDGGPYGLKIFKQIIKNAPEFLHSDGILLLEFGSGQDGLIKRILNRNGNYKNIIFYEYNNQKRVVSAQYNN